MDNPDLKALREKAVARDADGYVNMIVGTEVILAMIEKLEKQEIALKRIAESPTWTEKNQFGSLITFTYAATTVHWAKEALGVNVKPIEKGKSDE